MKTDSISDSGSDSEKGTSKAEPLEDRGFISRWSQRKLQNKSTEPEASEDEIKQNIFAKTTDDIGLKEASEQEAEAPETEEQRLEKLNTLTDEDMPDVDTLNEDSDYAGFMSSNVSDALRKIALQKLFHGKSYNIRDGLDEYDGDYTSFEKLDPSVITADMKHLLEVEAKKLLAQEEEEKVLLLAEAEAEESDVEEDGIDEGIDDESEEIVSSTDQDRADQAMQINTADVNSQDDSTSEGIDKLNEQVAGENINTNTGINKDINKNSDLA